MNTLFFARIRAEAGILLKGKDLNEIIEDLQRQINELRYKQDDPSR